MQMTTRIRSVCPLALLLLSAPLALSHAQPGVPPNDPDSWRLADTATTEIYTAKLRQGVDAAFATPEGLTAAFVVVYKGRIVAERYANGANRDMQLESWSAGKSIVGTLVGMEILRGTLRLEDPAP